MYKDSDAFADGPQSTDFTFEASALPARRGCVDSEYGRLRSVLLADPSRLEIVPCNSVSEEAIRNGRLARPSRAVRQHEALVAALEAEEVRVALIAAQRDVPDLAFTRDSSLMSPWGQIGLRPGAPHREREVEPALAAARAAGLPYFGRVKQGRVEGGDVAMIRPGLVAIGISGVRTDDEGADALAAIYERHGWAVLKYRFDPHFLHLDTLFCMVDSGLALACTDVIDDGFIARIQALGIEMVSVSYKDARRLGCNLLSLGDRRVVTSGTAPIADRQLVARGYRVIAVELDEFVQCGGGVHCLTMPLNRDPA